MRAVFFQAVMAGALALGAAPQAEAAPHNQQKTPAVFKKAATVVSETDCKPKEISPSKRVDHIFDLGTGTVIYSNVDADKFETTELNPASLTKLESIKRIMDRIRAGFWSRDQKFEVHLPPDRKKAVTFKLSDIVLAAANPSANYINDIVDKDFMVAVNEGLKRIGATHSNYITGTGLPTSALDPVRCRHKTTLADLSRSIRDFEQYYATPAVAREVLGTDKITGIWKLNIPGLHRDTHTIKIMENAQGPGARPLPGITSGKSGFTNQFGFGSYVRYEYQARSFIVFTSGHASAQARDTHTLKLIETNREKMGLFVEPKIEVVPLEAAAPVPRPSTVSLHALELLR